MAWASSLRARPGRAVDGAPPAAALYTQRVIDPEREARYTAEAVRLIEKLHRLAKEKDISIRSMEKEMGVGYGVFNKILRGKITLQFRHILMLCEAIEIDWKAFFADVLGLDAAPPSERKRELIFTLVEVGLMTPERAAEFLASLPAMPDRQ